MPTEPRRLRGVKVALPVVVEAASDKGVQIFDVAVGLPLAFDRRKAYWLGGNAGRQTREQRLFPGQTLKLPQTKADQPGQCGQNRNRAPQQSRLSQPLPHEAVSLGREPPLFGPVLILEGDQGRLKHAQDRKGEEGG